MRKHSFFFVLVNITMTHGQQSVDAMTNLPKVDQRQFTRDTDKRVGGIFDEKLAQNVPKNLWDTFIKLVGCFKPKNNEDDGVLCSIAPAPGSLPTLWLEQESDDVLMIAYYAFIREGLDKDLVDVIDEAISKIVDVEKTTKRISEKMGN
jgi:hypothetical protein